MDNNFVGAALRSMRLRTLPLSLSGIVTGIALALSRGPLRPVATVFLVLTAVLLQILVNLCNELGDYLSGTDTEQRQGIRYSMQDGEMGEGQMKKLIAVFAALSCLSGLLMIRLSFGSLLGVLPVAFILFGAVTVYAAMHYTLGKNPYGYRGLGDIAVFIFFGLATVLGGQIIATGGLLPLEIHLLPAAGIGMLSVAVLNVNNIRDMATDAATRRTVAIRLGGRRSRVYQTVLVTAGLLCLLAFSLAGSVTPWRLLWLLTVPLFVRHLVGVWRLEGRALDPMLPLLVMSTFALSILLLAGLL